MHDTIVIRRERADHPQVAVLLAALDRYLGELYARAHSRLAGPAIGRRVRQ